MIKVFIVDDEQPAIAMISHLLSPYRQVEIAGTFTDPQVAVAAASRVKPQLVFLDIDMPQLNGIEAALLMQEKLPGLMVLFVTAHRDYALAAFQAYPLDFILKPVDEKRFRQTMDKVFENLGDRRALPAAVGQVKISCFGRFEITVGERGAEPLKLGQGKIREVLAYLLHNSNRRMTRKELINCFFSGVEDRKTVNHLHVLIYKLRSLFEQAGISREQITINNAFSIFVAPGICDYTDFIRFIDAKRLVDIDSAAAVEIILNDYKGTYLEGEDYPWAIEEREWVEKMHEDLYLKLAGYYHNAGRFEPAENTLQRLLEHNNLSEPGWQALLQLYIDEGESGRFGKSKFQGAYERYRQLLTREFGSEPEERFCKHYRELL